MIRDYLLSKLRQEYGEPKVNPSSDWWIVGVRRPYPVHLCLNQPTRKEEAHMMIYDPRQCEGFLVVDARATTIEQADDILLRIRRIVDANDSPLC